MGTGPNIKNNQTSGIGRQSLQASERPFSEDSTLESDQLVRLTWHHFKCKARTACVFPTVRQNRRRSYFVGRWDYSFRYGYQIPDTRQYEFIIIRNRKNNWFFSSGDRTFLAFINIKSSNIWQFYVHFVAVNVLATKDMIFKLLMFLYT